MRPRTPVLGYQLRFRQGGEPETLIASDVADALRQARRRAFALKAPVAVWRDGRLVVECEPPATEDFDGIDPGLHDRLVGAGVYIFSQPQGPGRT
jgi:hypothetical protein